MGQVPEMGEPPQGTVYCFLNRERVCGGECEAFDPAEADREHDTACRVINALHRASVSLITMARIYQTSQPISGANIRPPGV